MKNLKFALFAVLLGVVGIFASCDNDRDSPINILNQDDHFLGDEYLISGVRSISSNPLGIFEITPSSGYVYNTEFTFTFYSTVSYFADPRVKVFVKFNSPLGASVYQEMIKIDTSSSGVTFQISNKLLREVGTYSCKLAYQIVGQQTKTPFGDLEFLSVNSNAGPAIDDYNTNNDSGYANYWCTAWVAWKVNQMWGTNNVFRSGMGNAVNWKAALTAAGYEAEQGLAIPGDIIWFSPNTHGVGSRGHVGFVHEVTNTTIYYTDYNGGYAPNQTFGNREISRNNVYDVYFIHMQTQK